MRSYRGIPIDKPKNSGEFVYGWYVPMGDKHYIAINDDQAKVPRNSLEYVFGVIMAFLEVHPVTVGQAVGLKDMDGKESYAGDIIQLPNRTYRIEWDNGNAKFILHPTEYNNAELINISYVREGKIIGTIHDGEKPCEY